MCVLNGQEARLPEKQQKALPTAMPCGGAAVRPVGTGHFTASTADPTAPLYGWRMQPQGSEGQPDQEGRWRPDGRRADYLREGLVTAVAVNPGRGVGGRQSTAQRNSCLFNSASWWLEWPQLNGPYLLPAGCARLRSQDQSERSLRPCALPGRHDLSLSLFGFKSSHPMLMEHHP